MSEPNPQPGMLLDVAGFSDAQLLALFVGHRDEAAFAEIVQRHRRLVWSVCRRVLSETHDIEDAFQATFLVLVRDASRIRQRQSLAYWLYGVAYRLSRRVSRQSARRREVELLEQHHLLDQSFSSADFAHFAELLMRQAIDEELHALPERYRQPLVLHYLSGKSQKDVAAELRLTVGAVDGLLKRGRHELRMRLARSGVTLGAVWLVLQWTEQAVQAAPLVPLTQTAVHAGLAFAAGKTAASVSAAVLELTRKELITMSLTTKSALALTAAVCVMGVVAGGGTWLFGSNPTGRAVEATIDATLLPKDSLTVHQAEKSTTIPAETTVALANPNLNEQSVPDESREASGGGTSDGQTEDVWDLQARSPAIRKIEAALKKSTPISFQDTPLTDVISFLSDYHNIPIILDTAGLNLNKVKIALDVPTTGTISGVSLESALKIMLSPLNLDYILANDVMMITTTEKAASTLEARVYDLSRVPNLDPPTLSSIVLAATKADAWSQKGGPGSLVTGPDFLVVNQNQRTHRLIVSLLDQLERQARQKAKRTPGK